MTEADLAAIENVERRRFLQAGLTVAWATPVILTLGASPASAQSCMPVGATCDACEGIACCVPAGAPFSCCCSTDDSCPDPAQVCRTPADCLALGGECFGIEGAGASSTSSTSMRTTSTRKAKYN